MKNPDFGMDLNWAFNNYVQFNLCKPRVVQFSIIVQESGISINIDRYSEVLDWGDNSLKENSQEVSEWIETVLTSTIRIEYCGKNYTKFYFLDKSGKVIKTVKHIRGLYLKINCSSTEYQPIYDLPDIETY